MATLSNFRREKIGPQNCTMGKLRTIIETAFYGNNVVPVKTVAEAYALAAGSPGTIVTDMEIYKPEHIGLPDDAKILISNDGAIVGRTASARRVAGEPDVDEDALDKIVMEAVYDSRFSKMYRAECYIGLDPDFMVKAHLLVPQGFENQLYSWMLNFQPCTPEYDEMYANSQIIKREGDIYVFTDPDWMHPDYPDGLAYFNSELNCAAILGMRYFGEYKKGTLTLAWGIANRHCYCSCHGGQKRYNLKGGKKFVLGVFGLSGSGKSTITHNRHHDKYDVTILHDDAFIIDTKTGASIALEPTYFDKTADYPLDCDATKYLLTMQNVGATVDNKGKIVCVTEDIRNGNGRAIKEKLWSPNRVDKIEEPINAIFWIMKDPVLPPILKINNPELAAVMGATLATKHSTAEHLAEGEDMSSLIYVPYANPFRTYPLQLDYNKFLDLFNKQNVECYIINTGCFIDRKITPDITLGCIEAIVEGKAKFKRWWPFKEMSIMEVKGFVPDMKDRAYFRSLRNSLSSRSKFIEDRDMVNGGYDHLPTEALNTIDKLIAEMDKKQ